MPKKLGPKRGKITERLHIGVSTSNAIPPKP